MAKELEPSQVQSVESFVSVELAQLISDEFGIAVAAAEKIDEQFKKVWMWLCDVYSLALLSVLLEAQPP